MRMRPRSIAGRMALALVAGVLLVIGLSVFLWAQGVIDRAGGPRVVRHIERVVTLAEMVDALPAERRPETVARLGFRGVAVAWEPTFQLSTLRPPGWLAGHLEGHLNEALLEAGLGPAVVGRDPGPFGMQGQGEVGRGPLLVWIRLGDGSWLRLALADDRPGPAHMLYGLLIAGVFLGGLVLLAVLVARWVTRPLDLFATAATRLGENVDAPPLAEGGPSEIDKAASAFNTMQARVKRLLEDRTLMLAAVSHDLRTPITRMRLRAEFVEDEDQRARMLADLDEMEAMIRDALGLARGEAGAEPPSRIDLAELLSALVEGYGEGRRLELHAPTPLPCLGREAALRRAFTNLLDNALAYGESARVEAKAEGGRIVVTIEDDGPGLPDSELERVFTPFYRLERSRSRTTGGSGLGLAIARNILRAHGGDVTLENRPEGGLRQRVVMPRDAS